MVSLGGKTRYICAACHRVTLGEPHLVAVTCSHCERVDLGTEFARQQWATTAEVRMANKPDPAAPAVDRVPRWALALVAAGIVVWVALGLLVLG